MKIKVLKNIFVPVNAIIGNRRFVIGQEIEVEGRLTEYLDWIYQKIKEGVFEEIKEKKVEIVKEEKPKRKYKKAK
jgi:hypothetical protein